MRISSLRDYSRSISTNSSIRIAFLMTVIAIISKGLGFGRELVIAYYYGTSITVDAYIMAQSIPDTLVAALIYALGKAFMPLYSEDYEKKGDIVANQLTSSVLLLLFIVCFFGMVVCLLLPEELVNLFAPGFSLAARSLTVTFVRITAFLLIGVPMITVFDPFLKYKGKFIDVALLELSNNIFIILFVYLSVYIKTEMIAFGVVCAFLTRSIGLLVKSKKMGYKFIKDDGFLHNCERMVALAIPLFIASIATYVNSFIDKMLASTLESGSVAVMNYSHNLIGLLSTVSYVIPTTIIYPKLNRAFANGDCQKVGKYASNGLWIITLLAVPFSAFLILYRYLIVKTIYEYGAFGTEATERTGIVLAAYAIGLLFLGITTICTNVLFAIHKTNVTSISSLISIGINILLNVYFVKIYGTVGLALATSIASIVNASILYMYIKRGNSNINGLGMMVLKVSILTMLAFFPLYILYAKYIEFWAIPVYLKLFMAGISSFLLYSLTVLLVFKKQLYEM